MSKPTLEAFIRIVGGMGGNPAIDAIKDAVVSFGYRVSTEDINKLLTDAISDKAIEPISDLPGQPRKYRVKSRASYHCGLG